MNRMSVKEVAKAFCEASECHHKCHDTSDCVVEDEALLLINENKSNNFDVKSNNEIEEMAKIAFTSIEEAEAKMKGGEE